MASAFAHSVPSAWNSLVPPMGEVASHDYSHHPAGTSADHLLSDKFLPPAHLGRISPTSLFSTPELGSLLWLWEEEKGAF